jgi:AbrB family looped-hinge helix DNA binding protein
MTNSVTSKGQVTIPKPVRKALGINTGTRVRITAAGNHARIEVVKTQHPSRPEEGPAVFNYRGPKITLKAMETAIRRRARRAS